MISNILGVAIYLTFFVRVTLISGETLSRKIAQSGICPAPCVLVPFEVVFFLQALLGEQGLTVCLFSVCACICVR